MGLQPCPDVILLGGECTDPLGKFVHLSQVCRINRISASGKDLYYQSACSAGIALAERRVRDQGIETGRRTRHCLQKKVSQKNDLVEVCFRERPAIAPVTGDDPA